MKKLMMAVCVVLMGMQSVKAQGLYELTGKAPFTIRFGQLSRYLREFDISTSLLNMSMSQPEHVLQHKEARKYR